MTADDSSRPQAPQESRLSRWLGPLAITGVFWMRLHHWAVTRLPQWLVHGLTLLFASLFYLILPGIRRAIGSNLNATMGPMGWLRRQRLVYATVRNHAYCLTERYQRAAGRRGPLEHHIEGEETWNELISNDEGFLLVTAHVGHWELGSLVASSAASADRQRPVHVVREIEVRPEIQAFTERMLQGHGAEGCTVHFVGSEKRFAAKLLFALRRGEIVALQGDRPSAEGRSIMAELCNRPISLPTGPAILGRTADVPLVPVFAFRRPGGKARIVVREPIRINRGNDRDQDLADAVQKIADQISWAVREQPDQWFCFRELWPPK